MRIAPCSISAFPRKGKSGLSLEHQRSVQSRQKRDARRFILDTSFHDRELAETVSRVSARRIIDKLKITYEEVHLSVVVDVVRGEVLIDSRGRGTFQK